MAPRARTSGKKARIIADNRKARFNFDILERFEAGIALTGTEVKSLREGKANIGESYASVEKDGDLYLVNAHIAEYSHANRFNHDPRRPRKLLMHRREIESLKGSVREKGMAIVPLTLYFNPKGTVKVELALARGRRAPDKREVKKARDWQRQKERLLKQHG